jgi:hypothetical protein
MGTSHLDAERKKWLVVVIARILAVVQSIVLLPRRKTAVHAVAFQRR